LTLQVKQLKLQGKQKTSPEFQESLSTDKSVVIHPVLWVHNPDTGPEQSTSQIHFFTRTPLYSFAVAGQLSLSRYHLLTPICNSTDLLSAVHSLSACE